MDNKTALLLIDVQTAMFSYENKKLYNEEKVLDNIVNLLSKARKAGAPVIFVQHTDLGESEYSRGKVTWEIYPKVKPLENEAVVEKNTWDAFYKTNLNDVLNEKGIKRLVIAGMQTEFCFDTTIRRAYSMGYHENILAKDAHSTFDSDVLTAKQIVDHHNNIFGGRFVKLMSTDEIEF